MIDKDRTIGENYHNVIIDRPFELMGFYGNKRNTISLSWIIKSTGYNQPVDRQIPDNIRCLCQCSLEKSMAVASFAH